MPCPFPISRQFPLSSLLAWNNLGYHATGTETVLPSSSSTVSESSSMSTLTACGTSILTAKVVIPSLHQFDLVFFDYGQNLTDFRTAEPTTIFKPDRVKPNLSDIFIGFDMDMYWLIPVAGIKETPISSDSQYCRHSNPLYDCLGLPSYLNQSRKHIHRLPHFHNL